MAKSEEYYANLENNDEQPTTERKKSTLGTKFLKLFSIMCWAPGTLMLTLLTTTVFGGLALLICGFGPAIIFMGATTETTDKAPAIIGGILLTLLTWGYGLTQMGEWVDTHIERKEIEAKK